MHQLTEQSDQSCEATSQSMTETPGA